MPDFDDSWAPSIEGAERIGRIVSAELVEGINLIPELRIHVDAAIDVFADDLSDLIGREVTWEFSDPEQAGAGALGRSGGPETAFRGRITQLRMDERTATLVAHGAAFEMTLGVRTRSYGGAPEPTAVDQLAGAPEFLRLVSNAELLDANAEHLFQHNESDWAFLLRMCARHGVGVFSVADGTLRLTDGERGLGESRNLPVNSILRFGALDIAQASRKAEALSWDLEADDEVTRPAPSEGRSQGDFDSDLDAAQVSDDRLIHRLYGDASRNQLDDATRSRRFAQSVASTRVTWEGDLDVPHVRPGDLISAPSNHALHRQGTMLVVRRTLSYRPQRSEHLFVNHVRSVTASSGLPHVAPALLDPREPVYVTGRVTSTEDPERRGRVEVRFPWNGGPVPGVWCYALQSMAGRRDGRTHGTWLAPQKEDWVRVLIDPNGSDPPTIVGAAYAGDDLRVFDGDKHAQLPVDDQEGDHLLLQTSNGIRLVARERAGELTLLVDDGDGTEMARVSLWQNGDIELYAARDFIGVIDRDADVKVGNDVRHEVGNNEAIQIGNNSERTVGNDQTEDIGNNRTETVGANEKLSVSGNREDTVSGNDSTAIQGNEDRSVSGNLSSSVSGNASSTVSGNDSASVSGNRSTDVGGNDSTSVGGSSSEQASSKSLQASTTSVTSQVSVSGTLAVS